MVASVAILTEPTLVLNKHWAPLCVCSVRRALSLVCKDVARIIAPENFSVHDFRSWADLSAAAASGEPVIRTVTLRLRVPEIIQLVACERFIRPRVVFCRRNLYRRDRNTCQYCGRRFPSEELSIDHVVPRALGGKSTWENCVVACTRCNTRKGIRSLEEARMRLLRKPSEPQWKAAYAFHFGRAKASWEHFVSEAYWTVELEE